MRGVAAAVTFALFCAAPASAVSAAPDSESAEPRRIGGIVTLDPGLSSRWCWSGAWRFPVGSPRDYASPSAEGTPGYQVNRNVGREGGHQGADLDNRRAGGVVRAAAHGIALVASDSGWNGGYGGIVVLAHRLEGDEIVFSVYAHLAKGSVPIATGDCVRAGQEVGRVGRTGRATTSHLHFEIRIPEDALDRWERGRVVDPIAFVAARLAPARPESTWAEPYLSWAEDAALLPAGSAGGDALDRSRWWSMLAHAARYALERLPDDPLVRRAALVAAGVLPEDASRDPLGRVGWNEMAWDLDRLTAVGVRVPAPAVAAGSHRERCERELGARDPARRPRAIATLRGAGPSLAQACLAVADVAGAASDARGCADPVRDATPSRTARHSS